MFDGNMFHPESFENTEEDGKITGFQFACRLKYYRGVTLSIIRDIEVEVDGERYSRERIRFMLEGATFSLDEMSTVIAYRWKFGQWAIIKVLVAGGLTAGLHHIRCAQVIAPPYMPEMHTNTDEYDFMI